MARSEARIGVSIWDDDRFTDLTPGAQRLYLFLLSQRDLTHAGTLALRVRRWLRGSKKLTEPDLRAALAELAQARFVVVDHDTEELLIRSFIRGDKVYRQPNVLASAIDGLPAIASPKIRAELVTELRRLGDLDDLTERAAEVVKAMIEVLDDEQGNPSGKGSDTPTDMGTGNHHVGSTYGEGVGVPPDPHVRDSPKNNTSDVASDDRPDVEQVCQHLADRVEANGSKRPDVTKRWRAAARLMLDRDGRTVDQVIRAIDWAQDHDFWRANVMSMPKLREKYEQLRLQAQRGARASPKPATDLREHNGLKLKPSTIALIEDNARFQAMDAAEAARQLAIEGTAL